ncbi:hypothetical protein AcidC75_20230 [Acidisoma sp. C75]
MPSDLQVPEPSLASPRVAPCLSPASFWTADHIVDSAWLEHGPFAFWLVDALRPRSFVELGSHNGFSYFCACQAVKTLGLGTACYAIDSWEGDEHAGFYGNEIFAAVSDVHERHYSDFSTLMRCYFAQALPYFPDGSIDLLHIDGRHGYGDVLEDFTTWAPKLSPRGVVIFHDTNVRERDFGVWRLWAELQARYPSFEFLHGHGLGVLAPGPEIPDGLKPLVYANEAERALIQHSYARLGRAFFLQREADRAKAEAGYLRQDVVDQRRVTEQQAAEGAAREQRIAALDAALAEAAREREAMREALAEQSRRLADAEEQAREALASAAAVSETIADHALALQGKVRVLEQNIRLLEGPASTAPGLAAERDALRQELEAIRNSTFWRRSEPLRQQLGRHPRLRRLLLGGAKLFWWSVTLRLPQRLAARRQAQLDARNAPPPPDEKARLTTAARRELADFMASDTRLRFPEAEAPEISIILILWNQAHLTLRCLRAIAAATGPSCEVILLDNGSTDETPALLERLEGARIIRSPENLGFLRGCNQAAAAARGRAILLLNNDAVLRPGSLHAALETLDSAPDIGAVGARIILPSGRLQEAGSIVWADGSCLGYLRGAAEDAYPAMFRRDVDYCSGACLLVRRSLWQQLGGFEPAFAPAYYEETDLCLRLQTAGFRVVYDPAVVIDHFEFGSEAAGGDSTLAMRRNQALFRERHAGPLRRTHLMPDGLPVLAARRAAAWPKPRLLVIDNEVPFSSGGAGYPRARAMLAAAVRAGWAVTLFPLHMASVDWQAAWREVPRDVEIVSDHGETAEGFLSFLRERRGFYDTILISRPENMTLVRGYLAAEPDLLEGSRLIYDSEALAASRVIARAKFEGHPLPAAEAEAMITEELALARKADAILCVNEAEARRFARFGVPVHVLAHTIPCREQPPAWAERSSFLFVGRLREQDSPNWVGLTWFVRAVWPLIRRALPVARLSIIGQLHPDHAALEAPGVQLLGPVEDLGPAYDAARVFIAPVHFAAGVPLKIIEAGAAGIPVVGTRLMAEQLLWEPGVEMRAADTAEEFAEACLGLHESEERWAAIQAAAQARVRREYGEEVFAQRVRDILTPPSPSAKTAAGPA